ncbi:MAG TPA: hypothetical protein VJ112_03505 [Rhabdochlamydiaceae bacterium]|nr:hypothetical protein [Rhabdochlamydiaceae bacterium]
MNFSYFFGARVCAFLHPCKSFLIFVFLLCFPALLFTQEDKTVLLAILARNKAHTLPYYLNCINNLDYNKKDISIYINTNNNIDATAKILDEWTSAHMAEYRSIDFVQEDYDILHQDISDPHDWSVLRWGVLAQIRNQSLQYAKLRNCDYYFVVDCDNFIDPQTLKILMQENKPIIAPMLRSLTSNFDPYSNYFCAVNEWGYYAHHPFYYSILNRQAIGSFEVPVVHCTYLIESSCIDNLTYIDGSRDMEFVIFSRSARNANIPQFICNKIIFGSLLHILEPALTLEKEAAIVKEYLTLPE